MASAPAIATRPMIELHMETDEKGEVAPVIPVTWSFTSELVDKLARKGCANPYLVIAVGYEKLNYRGFNEFKATKVYIRRLLDSSPKEFLEFSKPGTNVVLAIVVNVNNKDDEKLLYRWEQYPSEIRFDEDSKRNRYKLDPYMYYGKQFNIASFRHDVIVPAEMFAPEPPRFVKALVRQYFPNSEFDQCDFRRRFLISLAASVPVQIYGVVARLLTLVYALVFAKREMQLRLLFALNPHDFGNSLWYSFWYRTKDGTKRKSLLKWISPPQLILYALILAGVLLPGYVGALTSHLHTVSDHTRLSPFNFGDVLLWTAILDPILAVIAAGFFFLFTEKGSRLRKDWVRKYSKVESPYTLPVDPNMYDLLRKQAQVSMDATPDKVQNKTVRLKFLDLKSKVCKPFARVS